MQLNTTIVLVRTCILKSTNKSANPWRNLTKMLGEHTGIKLSCIKPTSKVRGFAHVALINACIIIVRD